MSNIFSNAIKGAEISVRLNNDGLRQVGRNAAMDRMQNTDRYSNYDNNNRGRGVRGNTGGRWQRGGSYRGDRGNRGGYRGGSYRGDRGGSYRGYRGGNRGTRGRGRGRGRGRTDEDEDGDMNMNDGGYGSYSHGEGRSGRRERSPDISGKSWWKVTIVGGKKHSRDWLIRRIKDACRVKFTESNFRLEGNDSVFFVDDSSVADALEDTSNRITCKDGSKVIITVGHTDGTSRGGSARPDNNSSIVFTEEKLQQLQQCLGQRYKPDIFKLDLSKLLQDPILKNASIVGNVANPPFLNKVLDIIHDVCPGLKILDLSNNHLLRLDNLAQLSEKCPELDELILSDNDIRFIGELSKLKDHKKIRKVWFKGNPGERQFSSDHSAYLTDVRKRLPEITTLDGVELPAVIKFELDPVNETVLPETKDAFASNPNDLELVKNFVQNYFKFYDHSDDSNDRQSLLDAYHNEAVFSLCCNTQLNNSKSASLSNYIKNSHNLKNIKDSKYKRTNLVIHKKLKIVAFLTELPSTKHILDTFSLDLTLSTSTMLCFTLQGIFLEGNGESPRGFSRTFLGLRENNVGFSVVNDELHVRNLTEKQMQLIESLKQNTPVANSAPQPTINTPGVSDAQKQEMATLFSQKSKMNLKFSVMCLEAANWNFDLAAAKFSELSSQGGLPAEAFVMT